MVKEIENIVKDTDVAIIGMSCRFPGASNLVEFWNNLSNGVESITFFNKLKDEKECNSQNKKHVNAGAVLNNIEYFDANFFGYSALEAEILDPQQRLFLECAWEALEDAGCNPHIYKGSIGVFAGVGLNTYLINNVHPSRGYRQGRNFLSSMADLQIMIGNDKDYLPTRVSYKFNLRGPSVNVQTACSTGLVAVHMACQSILNGECDMALAGASNIIVPQKTGYLYQEDMVFSPDGHCRTFDKDAKGAIFGNGVGVVLLKSAKAAIFDGDAIYAIIKGSAINNDGSSKVGYTAPSVEGQAAVISEAIAVSGVRSDTITYLEAHGTATPLGDPIEIAALTQAYNTEATNFCAIGSVKTNFGHLGWTAGIAGLIKTALSLKNKKLLPSLNFNSPNPKINFAKSPFFVNTKISDWTTSNVARRAGVSAFGIGGTNAHLILEEVPAYLPSDNLIDRSWHILSLSAKTSKALNDLILQYINYFELSLNNEFSNICFTANTGRHHHLEYRLSIVAQNCEDARVQLLSHLNNLEEGILSNNILEKSNSSKKIGFLFTGQGSQYTDMGRQLYETQPVFRSVINECNSILRDILEIPLLDILYPPDSISCKIDEISLSQPALFSIGVALASLWKSWGIEPDVVMGHSLGEYIAACTAGVFTISDGLKIVAERSRLMQALSSDVEMIAIFSDRKTINKIIEEVENQVSIAAENGTHNIVVSGKKVFVEKIVQILEGKKIRFKKLNISRAGHSKEMIPILDDFKRMLEKLNLYPPSINIISNLTGRSVSEEITTVEYWCKHTLDSVEFRAGIETLASLDVDVFIEIGSKPILLGMGKQCIPDYKALWLPSLRPGYEDWQALLNSLSKLYAQGYSIDWKKFDSEYNRCVVHLPTYPFQREKYWIGRDEDEAFESPILESELDIVSTNKTLNGSWKDWLYQVSWSLNEKKVLVKDTVKISNKWLIFIGKEDLGKGLLARLEVLSEDYILVYSGTNYLKNSNREFTINPDMFDDYLALFNEVNFEFNQVLYLWNIDEVYSNLENNMAENVWSNCKAPLYLFQALIKINYTRIVVWFVTCGAKVIEKKYGKYGLIQSPLWAMIRVVGMENPELKCVCIDLDPTDCESNEKLLLNEIASFPLEEQIAYRDGMRYVAKLSRHHLPANSDNINVSNELSNHESFLITGGLGGLGILIAERLIEKGARRLILVGRTAPNFTVTNKIEELKKLGVEIITYLVDVSDKLQLNKLIDDIKDLSFPLTGIIHAAGVIDDGIVQQLDKERFLKVLGPKVQGSWNLHKIIEEKKLKLKYFILFSSAVSLVGNTGQANHAVANAFMDTLAHLRHSQGLPALSINWGAWGEVGELIKNEVAMNRLQRLGFGIIPKSEGLQAFDYLMFQTSAQVGVVPLEWENFLMQNHLQKIFFYNDVSMGLKKHRSMQTTTLLQQITNLEKSERRLIFLTFIKLKLTMLLGKKAFGAAIEENISLFKFGMDSLSSIELKNILQEALRCKLPSTFIFDYPTITEIVDYLLELDLDIKDELANEVQPTQISSQNYQISRSLSMQQLRWLSLIKVKYGQRVVPIVFYSFLNETSFYEALLLVVERHELLRYCYPEDRVEILSPKQVIPHPSQLFIDVSNLTIEEQAIAIGKQAKLSAENMPDVKKQTPWSLKCLKISNEKFSILLSLQHIEFDGSSLTTFIDDLREAYYCLLHGKPVLFSCKPVQYYEYVEWQKEYRKSAIKEDRSFFEGMFTSLRHISSLPNHAGYEKTIPQESARFTPPIIKGLWKRVQELSSSLNISAFSILLAIYGKLMAEITGSAEVVIGMIVNGRCDLKFKNTIGPFTAPFPGKLVIGNMTLIELTQQCHRLVAAINARSCYPVADLVNNISAFKGFPIDTYFTDISVNFTNYQREEDNHKLKVKLLEILGPISEPEFVHVNTEDLRRIPGLHLVINILDNELCLNFWYHVNRFSENMISGWTLQYLSKLEQFLETMEEEYENPKINEGISCI